MYTDIIYLLSKSYSTDNIGNQVGDITKTKCYAIRKSVASKEFYNAVAIGLRPSYEFQIRRSNYKNESYIEYEGNEYQVIRTIDKSITDIVLVVEYKSGTQ